MKNVIIVHGCPSSREKAMDASDRTYDKHWMPWLKQELESKGIPTKTPLMPEPWEPVYERFKKEFEKNRVNEDTILIGHSCGGAFLIRWLGDSKAKIAKLLLVAPWRIPDSRDEARKKYYLFQIDKSIKSRVKEITMYVSDNEAPEGIESVQIYHKALGGKLVELPGRGHFTFNGMGTNEFPELLEECLKGNA